jgi:hypothetical protein
MRDSRVVTLSWSVDDAQEVADIFYRAATRGGTTILDRGYWEDYLSITDQIEEIKNKEEDAPRVKVVVVWPRESEIEARYRGVVSK